MKPTRNLRTVFPPPPSCQSVGLIVLSVTGLLMLPGRRGLIGRTQIPAAATRSFVRTLPRTAPTMRDTHLHDELGVDTGEKHQRNQCGRCGWAARPTRRPRSAGV